jgi:hypothetical protein
MSAACGPRSCLSALACGWPPCLSWCAMRRVLLLPVFILYALALLAAPRVEKIGALTVGSEKLKASVATEGYRVFLPNTLACCDVWLAKSVTAKKQEVAGANYPELHESEFLGVITFPKAGRGDFRGQAIKPGSYTMRYELLPADGNHMGVAPYPDFVLLIPVADDPDPSFAFDFAKMVELSSKASGTAHPAAFEMMPASDSEPASVTQTDNGWIVFQGSVPVDGKPRKIAFILKGSAE